MIKLVENIDEFNTSEFDNDVFFQRIKSEYAASSSFNDALFYVSVNDNSADAFVSKVGGNITLAASDKAPFEELNEFFRVIGYSVILCEESYSDYFYGEKTYGAVLITEAAAFENCKAKLLYSEDLKEAYNLVKDVFGIDYEYMFWFADMSHKIRHDVAKLCGISHNSQLVSCGFSLFETPESAVFSTVATEETFRSKGFGGEIVKKLLTENAGKNVYVFTENECLKNWYKKFGFAEYKKWSEIKNVL